MSSTQVRAIAEDVMDRDKPRTEADIQAGVRDLLLNGGLDLAAQDVQVQLESQVGDLRRIDVEAGCTVIEVKKDLRLGKVLDEAITQLAGYVQHRSDTFQQRYVGILTDGADWRLFHLQPDNTLQQVSVFLLQNAEEDTDRLLVWLGAVMATEKDLSPSPREVDRRLGSESPGFRLDMATLSDLWEASKDLPEIVLKRQLWARLLTTALGAAFEDDDQLFLNHTYLVVTAEIIAHRVLGIPTEGIAPLDLVSGRKFREAGVHGVVEADFFDWVAEVPGGDRFVRDLVRRLSRFDWSKVEHDVLKHLYESVIAAEVRKKLGEYYTPDWLADAMVAEVVEDPLEQRVLDPACGSGTFLFHAVRRYLDAADAHGQENATAINGLVRHVFGLDLHPVAVALARTTYLLAIGPDRLHDDRPIFAVPVWLGDSLQWQLDHDIFDPDGIAIQTDDGAGLFAERLRYPEATLADADTFDDLVKVLSDKATSRTPGSTKPKIAGLLKTRGITGKDADTLNATFSLLCELHDNHRDHIWAYYVRNLTRPLWLTRKDGKVDRLVGNPPWLAYRFMTAAMQETFKARCKERNLWTGGRVATQQDLSGYFIARASELYLKTGGRFAFVVPKAALTRQAFEGFRAGNYGPNHLAFHVPWDLEKVRPPIFPVPSGVVLGHSGETGAMPGDAKTWSGSLPSGKGHSLTEAEEYLSIADGTLMAMASDDVAASPYGTRFMQGATVVPRVLHVVQRVPAIGALGLPVGVERVRSSRSTLEKPPWKSLPDREGNVEAQFIFRLQFGSSTAPFLVLEPELMVLPWEGKGLMHPGSDRLDAFPLLQQWIAEGETSWVANRTDSTTQGSVEWLDYQGKMTAQFPLAAHRVVYSASGNALTAARVNDPSAVVEHGLYWAACGSAGEAAYLTSVLNAEETTRRVEPLQSRGLFGARHFDMYVWYLPIPEFASDDPLHQRLASLCAEAEAIATSVDVPEGTGFQQVRKLVRAALTAAGTAAELDTAVAELLGT
jgi:SAM-dependent methyltransferase